MLAHLDDAHHKLAVDKYVAARKKVYYQKRRNFKTRLRDSVKAKYYKKYGFVNCAYKWLDYETYRKLLEHEKLKRDKKLDLLKKKREAEKAKESADIKKEEEF
jgi:hypothetical protein